MERYGLTKQQVEALRAKGMPFVAVSTTTRLYEEDATLAFLAGLMRTAERQPRPRPQKEASNDA